MTLAGVQNMAGELAWVIAGAVHVLQANVHELQSIGILSGQRVTPQRKLLLAECVVADRGLQYGACVYVPHAGTRAL